MSKLRLKNNIARIARSCGLLYLISLGMKKNALILMYHRILKSILDENHYIQPGMYVLADTFRTHVEFLTENYTILSLAELVRRAEDGQNIKNCCAITFDDGWLDNYTHAFSVLKEFQIPATIFLATELVGTNRLFWPEELTFFLKRLKKEARTETHSLLIKLGNNVASQDSSPDEYLNTAIAEVKSWTPQDRQQLLLFFRGLFGNVQPERQLMNWAEAREMQESGLVSFGAHTANHVILDQVSLQEAETEIRTSRQTITKTLDSVPDLFAYPNGNFTPELKSLLMQHGFKGAVTTKKGRVGKSCDLLEIPRVGMHQDVCSGVPLFQARTLLKRF